MVFETIATAALDKNPNQIYPAPDRLTKLPHRRVLICVLSALAAGLVLMAASSYAQFVYVANGGGSNDVSAYRLGEDGALTPVPGSPFPAGNLPASVAVDPTGKFAYVVNEGGNNVSAYRIGKNGALTP
ncbi:MAG: beta-propeller fold lactonase family protein, partial [Terrimicrobiaceae bacterium]